jgi:hypothetical protein
MTVIKASDCREHGYCMKGVRAFMERHGLSFRESIKNGIPAEQLKATGDAMAIRLVNLVEAKRRG